MIAKLFSNHQSFTRLVSDGQALEFIFAPGNQSIVALIQGREASIPKSEGLIST